MLPRPATPNPIVSRDAQRPTIRYQVLGLTRPKPIRINPDRLPELTDAQKYRVKLFRAEFKPYGKVSIIRKGQKPGHILIVVTLHQEQRCYEYDETGSMTAAWTQNSMFMLGESMTFIPTVATTPYQED